MYLQLLQHIQAVSHLRRLIPFVHHPPPPALYVGGLPFKSKRRQTAVKVLYRFTRPPNLSCGIQQLVATDYTHTVLSIYNRNKQCNIKECSIQKVSSNIKYKAKKCQHKGNQHPNDYGSWIVHRPNSNPLFHFCPRLPHYVQLVGFSQSKSVTLLLAHHAPGSVCLQWICSTVCYGQEEMACHLHSILSIWDAVTSCTPVTDFFPLGVQLCSCEQCSKKKIKEFSGVSVAVNSA